MFRAENISSNGGEHLPNTPQEGRPVILAGHQNFSDPVSSSVRKAATPVILERRANVCKVLRRRMFGNKHTARVCLIESVLLKHFLDGSVVKNLPVHSSIPGLGKSLEVGNGNPLQYCLGNPLDRRLVGYSPCVAKSQTQLSDKTTEQQQHTV